jgi:hypothetical protein
MRAVVKKPRRPSYQVATQNGLLRMSNSLSDVVPVPDREVRALQRQAIAALAASHLSHLNSKGQFATARESVVATVPDAELAAALGDVRAGDGGELRIPKGGGCPDFHSIRSSCALAVASFGPWRLRPETLTVGERSNFDSLRFEVKFPITESKIDPPPNLDVVCWASGHAVAIESKLVEYIDPKHTAHIGSKYDDQIAESHPSWQAKVSLLRESPDEYRMFNAAQIIKHYLGLKRDKPGLAEEKIQDRTTTLLYMYWEPLGKDANHPVYREHRAEIADFASGLADPDLTFEARSYPTLWADWKHQSGRVSLHAEALESRYNGRSQVA